MTCLLNHLCIGSSLFILLCKFVVYATLKCDLATLLVCDKQKEGDTQESVVQKQQHNIK